MMRQVLQEWATVLDHIKPLLFECVITVGAGACTPNGLHRDNRLKRFASVCEAFYDKWGILPA